MVAVGLLAGKFCADDGDDRRERISQVVDCIEHDGDGVGRQAHNGLEAGEKHIGYDADDARTHDDALALCCS